jgi:hypothetical protein
MIHDWSKADINRARLFDVQTGEEVRHVLTYDTETKGLTRVETDESGALVLHGHRGHLKRIQEFREVRIEWEEEESLCLR